MKNISKILTTWLLVLIFLFNAVGCSISGTQNSNGNGNNEQTDLNFYIDSAETVNLKVGESATLKIVKSDNLEGDVVWTSSSGCVSVNNGVIVAVSKGISVITATLGEKTDSVTVNVTENENNEQEDDENEEEYIFGSEYPCITIAEAEKIAEEYTDYASFESYYIVATVSIINSLSKGQMYISDDTGSFYVYKSTYIDGSSLAQTDITVGDVVLISGTLRNYKETLEIQEGVIIAFYTPGEDIPGKPDQGTGDGGSSDNDNSGSGENVIVPGGDDPITSDPYVNVSKSQFYANYTPAISYMDAYYRTKHNLMSGSIADQDQEPTISNYRPTVDGKYVRNNVYLFSEDGNTYYVVNAYGEPVLEVYRGGAYITLEEVAAYVFAFGEPPVNQSYSKTTSPTSSPWGEYLRLNNTKFSGDTYKYPYEPALPRISGCGGDLIYFEMDIGTTGTDCDPSYDAYIYNNGYSITRGAARIVYSCKDINGNKIIDLDERFVFYTYNHYNDFQEYLNYYGGWGEMFGNITGGGTISSKYNYSPTPYVSVYHAPLSQTSPIVVVYYYVPKNEYVA